VTGDWGGYLRAERLLAGGLGGVVNEPHADKPSTWICEGWQRHSIETEICDFRRDRARAARSALLRNPVAQLVNVHSVLRLNCETLRGLISLASPSGAKLIHCGQRRGVSTYCLQAGYEKMNFRFNLT